MAPILLAESDEESGHEDRKSYLVFDNIYLNSEKKEEWGKRPTYYINTIFPSLSTQGDEDTVSNFNALIRDFLQSERADFKTLIKENQNLQTNLPKKLQKNDLFIDYSSIVVRSKKTHILSIRFKIQRYLGGMAHPELQHHTFNYDLLSDTEIELSSLFKPDSHYLTLISEIVNDSLSKKLNGNFDRKGIEPILENFKNWNIKSQGLLFTFDEGQVGPRVYGAQTVLVPYKSIPGLLAENTVIAHCVNRKSRCLSSNLATGGFLDEANASNTLKKHDTRTSAA